MERIESVLPTLSLIAQMAAHVVILAHRGRPGGREDPSVSLESIAEFLGKHLSESVVFVPYQYLARLFDSSLADNKITLVENIRFWPQEEEGNEEFALALANIGDVYVNEAFSVSHRKHVSLYQLPLAMKRQGKPVLAGLHFKKEVEHLSKVFVEPRRPLVIFLGGLKEDKLANLDAFINIADKVLLGGRLPEYVYDASPLRTNEKVIVGNLTPDKEDLTINSIASFENTLMSAGTILLAGPAGKYEDESHANGTKRVFQAIVASNAFKVAAGGDTQEALAVLGLIDRFDWVCVGGGAALEFLAKGTLPAIEALLN